MNTTRESISSPELAGIKPGEKILSDSTAEQIMDAAKSAGADASSADQSPQSEEADIIFPPEFIEHLRESNQINLYRRVDVLEREVANLRAELALCNKGRRKLRQRLLDMFKTLFRRGVRHGSQQQ